MEGGPSNAQLEVEWGDNTEEAGTSRAEVAASPSEEGKNLNFVCLQPLSEAHHAGIT
jgi:hypothetical protein